MNNKNIVVHFQLPKSTQKTDGYTGTEIKLLHVRVLIEMNATSNFLKAVKKHLSLTNGEKLEVKLKHECNPSIYHNKKLSTGYFDAI